MACLKDTFVEVCMITFCQKFTNPDEIYHVCSFSKSKYMKDQKKCDQSFSNVAQKYAAVLIMFKCIINLYEFDFSHSVYFL